MEIKKRTKLFAAFVLAALLTPLAVTLAQTITCGTVQVNNGSAQLDKTKTVECGECVWWTVKAGYVAGTANAQYERNSAKAYGTEQTCKSGNNSCTSVLVEGSATCPESDKGSPGG